MAPQRSLKNSDCNMVYNSFKSFFIFGKIFGLLPLSLSSTGPPIFFSFQSLAYRLVIGVLCLSAETYLVLTFLYFQTNSSALGLTEVLNDSVLLAGSSYSCFNFIFFLAKSSKIVQLIYGWKSLNIIRFSKFRENPFLKFKIFVAFVLFIYIPGWITYDMFRYYAPYYSDKDLAGRVWGVSIILAINTFQPIHQTFTSIFFAFICELHILAYNDICVKLENVFSNKCPSVSAWKIRREERIVSNLLSDTQSLFSIPLAVTILYNSGYSCVLAYFIIRYRTYPYIIAVLMSFAFLVTIIHAADKVKSQNAKLLKTICDIDYATNSVPQEDLAEISMLRDKVSKCPPQFTACTVFTVHLPLLTTIFGAIVTYLTILIQFQNNGAANSSQITITNMSLAENSNN